MATYLPASFAGWGSRKKIAARVQALFGFDPRLRQSGKWQGKVAMSKRGIAAGRTALFQAAFCSLDCDEDNAAYYRRLRDIEKRITNKPWSISCENNSGVWWPCSAVTALSRKHPCYLLTLHSPNIGHVLPRNLRPPLDPPLLPVSYQQGGFLTAL